MNARTVFLIALGLAVVLPYVTVLLLERGGVVGIYAITGIFLGAILLVVLSDRGGEEGAQPDDA